MQINLLCNGVLTQTRKVPFHTRTIRFVDYKERLLTYYSASVP